MPEENHSPRPNSRARAAAWTRRWLEDHASEIDGLPRFEQIEAVADAFREAHHPFTTLDELRLTPIVRMVAQELVADSVVDE